MATVHILATTTAILTVALTPAAQAEQRQTLAGLCGSTVMVDTIVLRTVEVLPLDCTVSLADASLRIVGAEISAGVLVISRSGSAAVEIVGSEMITDGDLEIAGGTGQVRLVDSLLDVQLDLSGADGPITETPELNIATSGDIVVRRSEVRVPSDIMTLATDDGLVDVADSILTSDAGALVATEAIFVRSSDAPGPPDPTRLDLRIVSDGAAVDLVFTNNMVGGFAPVEGSFGDVVMVANTIGPGPSARILFDPGTTAQSCVINANDGLIEGADAACP